MTPARVHLIVNCLLVMRCGGNVERCRLVGRLLALRGFESQWEFEDGWSCRRSLVREHAAGDSNGVLDSACADIQAAIPPDVNDWKAFLQVSGKDSAWATLQAGKPPRRGGLPWALPRPKE